MPNLYPSLISADLLNLEKTIHALESYCAGFHLDVMDNHFVPNLTMGPDFVNAIARACNKPVWVHLMVDTPETLIESLNLKPGSTVSFHIEATDKILDCIKNITEKKLKAGLAISPKTDVEKSFPFLDKVDQLLLMSVEPGYSGQPFIESAVDKIAPLAELRTQKKMNFRIAMDGGINATNISALTTKGVDDFALAAAIFNQPNPAAALQQLTKLTQ